MPVGPQGQVRPSDVVGGAVRAMKIATGEVEEDIERPDGEIGSQIFVVDVPDDEETVDCQAIAESGPPGYPEES